MDYINLTTDQMFRLVSLQNVTDPYLIKGMLEQPAVPDLLMELHNYGMWPSGTYVTHRLIVRDDIDLDLGPDDTEYMNLDGTHTLLTDAAMKQRITDMCVHMTSSTYTLIDGNTVKVAVFCSCMTAVKGGMDVIVDLPCKSPVGLVPVKDSTQAVNVGQFIFRAWLELNWLVLNQPQSVRTGRIAQDLIPSLKKTAGKPRKKKAAKGRTKVYLRMLTVPPEKSLDWETLKAKTPEAVQERAIREITCPVWEVRGHMRHYKSGKTVYVAPYRKGKERDSASTVSGKEYVLTGGDHAGKD